MSQTKTEINPENKAKLFTMIDKIYNRKDAIDFRFPVDYVAFGNYNQDWLNIQKLSKK